MQEFKDAVALSHDVLRSDLEVFYKNLAACSEGSVALVEDLGAFLQKNSGKLLRPVMLLLIAHILGKCNPNHMRLAVAVESIHMATLLHDDVIDNSELRHNLPTIHKLWNPSAAILMGDYLFSKAFQIMVETNNLTALHQLAYASTIIAQGELHQLENIKNTSITFSTYLEVITAKTALLFETSTHLSAAIAQVPTKVENLARKVGRYFGMAYQMLDDIHDFRPRNNHIGKQPGDDLREGKVTLPFICSLANNLTTTNAHSPQPIENLGSQHSHLSPNNAEELFSSIVGQKTYVTPERRSSLQEFIKGVIKQPQISAADIKSVENALEELGAFSQSYQIAQAYVHKALACLDELTNLVNHNPQSSPNQVESGLLEQEPTIKEGPGYSTTSADTLVSEDPPAQKPARELCIKALKGLCQSLIPT